MEEETMGRESRRYSRIPCTMKITYTILSSNDATPYEYGVTRSRDLSEGGVCIVTDRPVRVPILMQLNLNIPVRPFHLLVLGKTVRSKPIEDGLFEIGIKFVGILPPCFKEMIGNYIPTEEVDIKPATPPLS